MLGFGLGLSRAIAIMLRVFLGTKGLRGLKIRDKSKIKEREREIGDKREVKER